LRCAAGAAAALGACSAPAPPARPQASTAPLSLAADAAMVAISGGRFVAGSTREERLAAYDDYLRSSGQDTARAHGWFDNEDDRYVSELPQFRIDLLPVTQAAYAEVVAAGQLGAPGIEEPAWRAQNVQQPWSMVERYQWHDGHPPIGREEHPVVLVSWHDADRYCRWRGELVGAPRRLASAAEYEKAARGDDGLVYPWGNAYEADRLNSAVAGPGETTPVGQYPGGASPYGVLELAGNVFEWTDTPMRTGEMTVKGSAWDEWAGVGRGAARHGRALETRHVIVGFRCAGGR
jgi:formylglycine-generating enzyme required for sulfatase activity